MTDNRPVYSLSSEPATIKTHEEALERARELREPLRKRLAQGQELRRLPGENVADILESGLFGVMKPKRYGGSELGTKTLIDVTIELASADVSTGWVYMLWTSHMWLQSLWPEKAMGEMFENPNTLASSVVSTSGDVRAVDGGYQWTGRGLFSSGVDHCNWLTAMTPIVRDGETSEIRWLLIPREDFEIIDDWNTVGLRGTGSKSIVLNDVFVPEYRTVTMQEILEGTAPGRYVNTNPMYGGPLTANFTGAMSAPAIGAAVGFLELFRERLSSKLKVADTVKSPYVPGGISATMSRLAWEASAVDASRALETLHALQYSTKPVAEISPAEAESLRRDSAYTAQQSRRAVNRLYEECGGSGLLETSLLQQFWRDTNAAAAHHALTWDWQSDGWVKAAIGIAAEA